MTSVKYNYSTEGTGIFPKRPARSVVASSREAIHSVVFPGDYPFKSM